MVPVNLSPTVRAESEDDGEVLGHIAFTRSRLDAPRRLVFLEGSPAYYSRFGFRAGGDLGFRRPSLRIPEPAFQVWPLAAYEPWMTGTLVHHRAFWDHDSVGLRD